MRRDEVSATHTLDSKDQEPQFPLVQAMSKHSILSIINIEGLLQYPEYLVEAIGRLAFKNSKAEIPVEVFKDGDDANEFKYGLLIKGIRGAALLQTYVDGIREHIEESMSMKASFGGSTSWRTSSRAETKIVCIKLLRCDAIRLQCKIDFY